MVDVSDKVYTKQEQVPATAEITEVAPNILRTQLPIDMPGLGHVNMYVLEDSRGVAVVDPGLPGKATWQAINNRLAEIGVPLRRVHSIIVTNCLSPKSPTKLSSSSNSRLVHVSQLMWLM